MTNRIPPLHPASPPPMCKLDFSEDEIEENDDFGDFSTAVPEFINNRDDTVINTEDPSSTVTDIKKSSTPELNNFMNASTTVLTDPDSNHISGDQTGTNIEREYHDGRQSLQLKDAITEDVTNVQAISPQPPNAISDDSINTLAVDFSALATNDILITPASTFPIENDVYPEGGDEKSAADDYEIIDETYLRDVSELDAKEESELRMTTTAAAAFTLSSDEDSETLINESAFVIEGDTTEKNEVNHDDSSDFGDYRTETLCENVNSKTESECLGNATLAEINSECRQTTVPVTDDEVDLFASAFVDQTESESKNQTTTSPVSFDFVDATEPDIDVNWNRVAATTDRTEVSNSKDATLCELNDTDGNDDDEFSEFVSPTNYVCAKPDELQCGDHDPVQPNEVDDLEFDAFSSKTCVEVSDSFDPSGSEWNDIFQYSGENPIEVNVNTIEGKLNSSSVWCRMKNVETSPALNYNWSDSEANKVLLSTLCVDSRNILFGPRWNSEVPRFASNLGFSPLVPQKASSNESSSIPLPTVAVAEPEPRPSLAVAEPCLRVPATVPDAHFDWNNSGLTNPLDTCKPEKIKEIDVGQLDYDSKIGADDASHRGRTSSEAATILNNLPNLLVMEKQYIVFPIR